MAGPISSRARGLSLAAALALGLSLSATSFTAVGAQEAVNRKNWVAPRTSDGKPDLQGNWSNETQTPLERMGKQGLTLTE
jgi:hypothetical protein